MIPQIKKILYATDLARKHEAKIVILHCIASMPPAGTTKEGSLMETEP